MNIDYFYNEKGDYTITLNDEPIAIALTEENVKTLVRSVFDLKTDIESYKLTIDMDREELDKYRKLLHEHNGMCQKKLSEQLEEVLPGIKEDKEKIASLTSDNVRLKDEINLLKQTYNQLFDAYKREQITKELNNQVPTINEPLKGLYTKPFVYDKRGQMIFDAKDHHVLDIRSWGRIQYKDKPEVKQDAFGEFVAKILNDNWK